MDNYIVSARKYRPSTFRSVVGQKSLTTTLKNAIQSNKLAHAYLFCGPRGAVSDTHLHLGKVTAYAHPVCEVVADGQIKSLCLDFAGVDIGCRLLAATQICDVTLYVIFRIAVDHSTFHIQGMFSECLVVAQVEVYIVAIFRSDAQFAHFQVFVTEHLFDGRQAISFFVRQLGLQACQDEVGSGLPVSE